MSTTIKKIPTSNNILTGSASQLVVTRDMVRNFGSAEDYVEMNISDPSGKNIYSIVPFTGYTIPGTFQPSTTYTIQELNFDPALDLKNAGIQFGDYVVTYNILRPVIVKSYNPSLFIKEISGDRTEIRLSTNNIPNDEIITNTNEFIQSFQSTPYFKEFYLNFGKNQLLPAVNVALDLGKNPSVDVPTVLIKLLNPLPVKYRTNNLVNVVDEISNPQIFEAVITPDTIPVVYPTLRGPNFDLDLDQLRVGPTPYYNFNQVTNFQGDFAPQLQQLLGQLSASNFSINVDYTEYKNFVHFSSAARRLEGFQYKLSNIELFTSSSASAASSTSPSSLLDAQKYQNNINKTIQSFDGWEQYLYFESTSFSWPKQNYTKPYINQSITSSESVSWYSGNHDSASLYDDNNQNYLLYTLPGYIAENNDNELAFEFVASIGQMFDDIWIHIKAISDLYQSKNALNQGISKDLVYFALQSMGITTYTDEDGTNVFKYLYGVDENGNYLPNTGSYDTLITASQYQISGQDQQKGIYKRLYHNLPLLLKSKGTNRFNQYLNTIFGIPPTIMGAIEYGGVDKVTSSFEYEYDRFTYAIDTSYSGEIVVPWVYLDQNLNKTGYNDIAPNGIEFRFKTYFPSSNIILSTYPTQSLLLSPTNFKLDLIYTQTGSNDSIYAGTTGDFGYFQFTLGSTSITSSTIPVFTTGSNDDTSWYSVLLQRRYPNKRSTQTSDPQYYDLYVKNNIYGEVGHKTSASLYTTTQNASWYIDDNNLLLGNGSSATPFTGSYQEVRLWSNYISESVFDSHVLNPESIEGNFTTSSFGDLAARFTLGNNLYTYNHSITTKVYSTHPDQKTQILTASFIGFPNQNSYVSFTETYYADVANSGYANPVTDKIRIVSGSTYGNQLMPNKSIEAQPIIPLTKDIHLLDASLSPQDEIDRAIIAQFGSTYNLDDIIGNPATGSYQQFQVLQNDFFKKFNNKYNYKDYIRLISFFHNSLFRTLKDFTPARTNLSTGIVIKPHLLERPVIQRYEPTITHLEYSQSIDTAFFTASNGGNYSQSLYIITHQTPFGPLDKLSDASDFYTGELPSASIECVATQSNPFIYFNPYNTSPYSESIFKYEYDPLINNVPNSVTSSIRQKLTYITSASVLTEVLEPIELQDFTYQYLRHARPRYIGSQTNSSNYNFFNNNDFNTWKNGIGPYGRNAVIDKNTIQFAYFSEATCTGSFQISMPERTNLYIKYLIDETGSLTELAQRDYANVRSNQLYNLYQVQNIFKTGEQLNVALFNNQSPSLQKTLDGNQFIHSSGYKYYPVLWRIADTDQNYYVPSGYSSIGVSALNASNYTPSSIKYRVITHFGWFTTSLTGTVTYTPASLLPYDVIVRIRINVVLGTPSYVDVLIPRYGTDGITANYTGTYRVDRSGIDILQSNVPDIVSVRPAANVAPSFLYNYTDASPELIVHDESGQPTDIISCSAGLALYYGNNEGIYFSGSVLDTSLPGPLTSSIRQYNTYCPPDYPFYLNPGDIVRFESGSSTTGSTFRAANEYTILEVNYNSLPSPPTLTFKVDRVVNNAVTMSSTPYNIDRYVFSKKIEDETNIIIEHRKNIGPTSPGIIKNQNLLLSIDDKVANIVSELKSKIFSTVLTN